MLDIWPSGLLVTGLLLAIPDMPAVIITVGAPAEPDVLALRPEAPSTSRLQVHAYSTHKRVAMMTQARILVVQDEIITADSIGSAQKRLADVMSAVVFCLQEVAPSRPP